MLNKPEINNIYPGTDLEAMSFAKNYNHWIIDMLCPYLGKTVGEVGSGNGNLSNIILSKEVDKLVAFEPSLEMHKKFLKKFSTRHNVRAINNMFSTESNNFQSYFDCILYVNVLEHIENDEVELKLAYDSLKTGGYLCIFVPALSFLYSNFDKSIGHFRRYHKRQLRELVETSDFVISTIKYVDIFGIIPWYISFVLLDSTFNSSKVSLYDNWVIPIVKIMEKNLAPVIGKNLLVVGRKV